MPKTAPRTDACPGNTRGRSAHGRDVPIAGLLRDSIVGITCFPDPLPRCAGRGSRRRGKGALARAARAFGLARG
jgi:hypothetical protein